MGLVRNKVKKPTTETAAKPAEETTQESAKEAAPEETAQGAPAEVPATTAGTDVSTDVLPQAPSIKSLENVFDAKEYGNLFDRVVGSNGSLVCGDIIMGEFIDVQVLSTSDRWMITPDAEQSDKKAKKLCRASYDGKVIPGLDGEPDITIDEWKEEIENAGYEPNKVSKYRDVFAVIFNAEKNADKAKELGVVQISVSPTSSRQLKKFTMQTMLFERQGKMVPSHRHCMRVVAVSHTGDMSYTTTDFKPVPLDVLAEYTPVSD